MLEVKSDFIISLIDKYGSPLYVFDEQRFEHNIDQFKNALSQYFSNYTVSYSFKTNYTPRVCSLVKKKKGVAEVVSRMELELAVKLGFPEESIIFNGPLKSKSDLKFAIEQGALINLDNIEQVKSFCSLSSDHLSKARIGLRYNIDLSSPNSIDKLAKGGVLPRFGMVKEDIACAKKLLDACNVPVIGLHGHSSSSDRAPENYNFIAKELLSLRKLYALDSVKYINVGGGYYGSVPKEFGLQYVPTFVDYAKAIHDACQLDDWFKQTSPTVVVEPGMALIADAISYLTQVEGIKEIAGKKVLGVDGSYFDIRPTMHDKPLPYVLFQRGPADNKQSEYMVTGSTCMEKDILFHSVFMITAKVKDILFVSHVGAYCSVLRPDFINYSPAVIALRGNNEIQLIKKRQTFNSFFADFNIV